MKRNRHFWFLTCFPYCRHSLMLRSWNPVALKGALRDELRQGYPYRTSPYAHRWSLLKAESGARWTVFVKIFVKSICQNLIIIWAEFKETNNAVWCKRWYYICMAQLQLWKNCGLGKYCADALISVPEVMWSKDVKYALCSMIKAGQVSVLAPTNQRLVQNRIRVPQSSISTLFSPF